MFIIGQSNKPELPGTDIGTRVWRFVRVNWFGEASFINFWSMEVNCIIYNNQIDSSSSSSAQFNSLATGKSDQSPAPWISWEIVLEIIKFRDLILNFFTQTQIAYSFSVLDSLAFLTIEWLRSLVVHNHNFQPSNTTSMTLKSATAVSMNYTNDRNGRESLSVLNNEEEHTRTWTCLLRKLRCE